MFVYTATPHTPQDWKVGLFSSWFPIYYFQIVTICPLEGGDPPPLKLVPFHDVMLFPLPPINFLVTRSGTLAPSRGLPSPCELCHGSGRLRGSRMKTCLILCPSPHFLDISSPQRPAAPKTVLVLVITGHSPSCSLNAPDISII